MAAIHKLMLVATLPSCYLHNHGFCQHNYFISSATNMSWKSVAARMISCLVFIGLLPSAKSKLRDKISLIAWLIISLALTGGWFHVMWDGIIPLVQIRDVPSLMRLMTLYVSPVFQTVGSILACHTAAVHYPKLIKDPSIPNPSNPWFFLIVVFSNLTSAIYFIVDKFCAPIQNSPVDLAFFSAMMTFLNFDNALCAFLIGTSTACLNQSIQRGKDVISQLSARTLGAAIVEEFRSVKMFLSPMLFIRFVCLCSVAIVYSYRTVVEKENQFFGALACVLLVLVYMCLVIENCYGYFKSVAETLRY